MSIHFAAWFAAHVTIAGWALVIMVILAAKQLARWIDLAHYM